MTATRSELAAALAKHIGTTPLTEDEIESVLELAGIAAHGTGDRTSAPLVSFLAGIAAEVSHDRASSLEEIRRYTAELAPPPEAV